MKIQHTIPLQTIKYVKKNKLKRILFPSRNSYAIGSKEKHHLLKFIEKKEMMLLHYLSFVVCLNNFTQLLFEIKNIVEICYLMFSLHFLCIKRRDIFFTFCIEI